MPDHSTRPAAKINRNLRIAGVRRDLPTRHEAESLSTIFRELALTTGGHVAMLAGLYKEKSMLRLPLAVFTVVALLTPAKAQDIDAGERSFRKCTPCHSIGADAQNKLGPILNGLDGRKSGTIEGYNYTEANKNSGIVWDDKTFSEYIIDPRAKIPSTKMIFPGIKNEKERGDLWAYIKQFDKDGKK
jgi:cytochrome c